MAKGGQIKAENLLEGDRTQYGTVVDTFGCGPEVLVDFDDGTHKRFLRGEFVQVD